MKINNISSIQNIDKYKKIDKNEQEIMKKESKKDQISISNKALEMFANNENITRSEKVAELKTQIENGSYQVDSKLLAEKISYLYSK